MAMAVLQFRRCLFSKSNSPFLNLRRINKVEKCPEGYIRVPDVFDREVFKRNWKSPTGKTINFVLAHPKDFDMLSQFWAEEFIRTNNMCRHLGITYPDFESMASATIDKVFKQGDALMAFWGDRLVSTFLLLYHDASEFPELFGDELPGNPNPVLRIKDDYADDIASMPFTPKVNRCAALLTTVQSQTGKFLPSGVEKLGIFEAIVVHPELQKDGIGAAITNAGEKIIEKRGVTNLIAIGVANYSTRITHKIGFETLFKFYFKDFKENGKPVFYDLFDGSEYVCVLHRAVGKE
uniref:N-acetyltransferase domain-containing protein n=1 Tax=Panagrellus redivivus TaxID=6233 RepID=A0A7E4ZTE5_PANRE